jgi:hypothetical protein
VLFHFAHKAAGASSARHSLRPLFFKGQDVKQNSRDLRGENAKACPRMTLFENLTVGWAKARLRRAHHVSAN